MGGTLPMAPRPRMAYCMGDEQGSVNSDELAQIRLHLFRLQKQGSAVAEGQFGSS